MGPVCRACRSSDFTIESCERVCTTCGEVQDDYPADQGNLCMLPDEATVKGSFSDKKFEACDRLTNRIRNETNSCEARRQIGREKLLEETRRTVRQLMKDANAIDETMNLMKSTLKAHQGRLIRAKVSGFAGACIYFISAKHQLGLSLTDISKAIGLKMKVISVCLKQVKNLCPDFEFERPNIKDLVKRFVDQMASKRYNLESIETNISTTSRPIGDSLGKESQSLIDNKDKMVLQDRVMMLIDLFEAMHPYNQPTPQSLVTAVTYHAWRSLDTFKLIAFNLQTELRGINGTTKADDEHQEQNRQSVTAKHSISYEKFCQLCDLKYSSNGHKIVTKLQSSLLMLGKYLGDVNKINLPWFLKDIIENSPHLIKEHIRTEPTKPKASYGSTGKEMNEA